MGERIRKYIEESDWDDRLDRLFARLDVLSCTIVVIAALYFFVCPALRWLAGGNYGY